MKRWFYFLFKGKMIFLVRYPSSKDLNDGYFQRVKEIDRIFVKKFRIYFNVSQETQLQLLKWINDNCLQINLNPMKKRHVLLAIGLAIFSGIVYTHSVLRLDTKLTQLTYRYARKSIFDVHGAVPEEFAYNNDINGENAFNLLESFAIKNSYAIIGVTKSMVDHLKKKHKGLYKNQKFYIIPIMQEWPNYLPGKQIIGYKPTIIYAGGIHKWQQIDKMLEFVYTNRDRYDFIFLTTDTKHINKRYLEISGSNQFPGELRTVSPSEVYKYYAKAQFGLVLRESIIVNKVACPTKLIEYMMNDLVPIVDCRSIGDFEELGYKSITYNSDLDLAKVNVQEIYEANKAIIRKIESNFVHSVNQLQLEL